MTEELEMPKGEEGVKLETRMVVMSLELPKMVWWSIDMTEKRTGISSSESLSNVLQQELLRTLAKMLFSKILGEGQ